MPTIQQLVRKGRQVLEDKSSLQHWTLAHKEEVFVSEFTQLHLKSLTLL